MGYLALLRQRVPFGGGEVSSSPLGASVVSRAGSAPPSTNTACHQAVRSSPDGERTLFRRPEHLLLCTSQSGLASAIGAVPSGACE